MDKESPTRHTLPDPLMARFSEFLATRIGLHYPPERWGDLERAMDLAARKFRFPDAGSCIRWLVSSPLYRHEMEMLASHLAVGETYFFRERAGLDALEHFALPELIRSRTGAERRMRIWSAGCCTGEEPYSIAILLDRRAEELKHWNISILGTDINPHFLKKAEQGRFPEWSFRGTPAELKAKYFRKARDGGYEILARIREKVTFSNLNLMEDVYPSLDNNTNAMDVIFCRNVLMYFAPQRAANVVDKFYRALVEGGWLIVSAIEASHTLFSQFTPVAFPGGSLYRKDTIASGARRTVGLAAQRKEAGVAAAPKTASRRRAPVGERKSAAFPQTAYKDAAALYAQGSYPEAAMKIREWLSLRPADVQAMALLARIHANQGRLTDALESCNRAMAVDRLNPAVQYLLATIFQELGKTAEAVKALKRTLYLDHDFVLAHLTLGNLTREQGKIRESHRHFRNALSLLDRYAPEAILPESEGVTAGRLTQVIQSAISSRAAP